MKTLCIIPAYNEENSLAGVIKDIKKYKNKIDKIVVIDDASGDRTAKVARKEGVDVVSHVINRGPGCGLQTGFDIAIREDFDYLIQIDADGQHDPSRIPEMLEEVKNGCKMVIGSRYLNKSYSEFSLTRRMGIKFFTKLINMIAGTEITDITSGYRVWEVDSLRDLGKIRGRHWAIEHTLEFARKGGNIEEVSVEMPERSEGESQFDLETFVKYPFKMLKNIVKVILYR